jgi:hypothetical protein
MYGLEQLCFEITVNKTIRKQNLIETIAGLMGVPQALIPTAGRLLHNQHHLSSP